ncbi:unnamed protein product [Linum tenue]|uniref:RING-type E3 ubiquitin transferase n=3 Tax=Linum tenue TaxID=586396 RepID=A0AAV0GTQ0_9ROSI|nr:unnamed protein product [Linum tenue]
MSLSHHHQRPRVTVNGVRRMRTFHYFWCYHCGRTLRFASISPHEMFCPHCFGTLSPELDMSSPRLAGRRPFEPAPAPERLLESLSLMIHPRRMSHYNDHPSRNEEHFADRWITLHFPPTPPPHQATAIVNEDRPGPPPASPTAIEALPTVKITAKDPNFSCPVCKEEFEAGEEGKEMPCQHLYHTGCIVPWLAMHNTCPVCRYALPSCGGGAGDRQRPDGGARSNNNYDLEEWTLNGVNWVRDRLFSVGRRPIRVLSDWTLLCMDMLDRRIVSVINTAESSREGE